MGGGRERGTPQAAALGSVLSRTMGRRRGMRGVREIRPQRSCDVAGGAVRVRMRRSSAVGDGDDVEHLVEAAILVRLVLVPLASQLLDAHERLLGQLLPPGEDGSRRALRDEP
eukprot:4921929-Prymnesium_polylepis.1